MMGWIKKQIKQAVTYHTTDMSGVVPEFRLRNSRLFFNSPAGVIEFYPRSKKELCAFRDVYLNRFEILQHNGKTKDFFDLYREIRNSSFKIKFKANAHTRISYLWK